MNETAKCYDARLARGDFHHYLRGDGIDIGGGPDCLRVFDGTVRPWDLPDGDAQVLATIPDGRLDFVYASHCLEHVRDVGEALRNWVRVLRPGGHLYVVVPDFILYEKMHWPSRLDPDHKQSFSFVIDRGRARRANHFHVAQDLVPLLDRLGVDVRDARLEDDEFDYTAGPIDQTTGRAVAQLCVVGRKRRAAATVVVPVESTGGGVVALSLPPQIYTEPEVAGAFSLTVTAPAVARAA